MKRILMVCLGNICRSPMAQGILEHKLRQESIEAEVDSAGTAGYHIGDPPDHRATRKAAEKGIDISVYRGRQFNESDFNQFDLIFAMDNYNYLDIISLARDDSEKSKVEMILNRLHPGEDMSVPDPYYGGEEGFENVFKLLDAACDRIIDELRYEK